MRKIFAYIFIFGYKIHKNIVKILVNGLHHTLLFTEAFWLTVLSKKQIAAIDDLHYSRSKKYLGKDFNKSMLNNWEKEIVDIYFSDCKTLMVLASGGGREVYALAKSGFIVEGYECNAALVERSIIFFKQESMDVHVAWVLPDHCPDNGKIYDGVILGWGAYIHVKGKEKRIALLKEINVHLKDRGTLLVSFWYANSEADAYCSKLYQINKSLSKIFRTQPIEKGQRLTAVSGKYFTMEEVAEELNEAGFEVVYQAAYPYGHMVGKKD